MVKFNLVILCALSMVAPAVGVKTLTSHTQDEYNDIKACCDGGCEKACKWVNDNKVVRIRSRASRPRGFSRDLAIKYQSDLVKEYCCAANPSSYGDPHFKTWSGQEFDFHGGCDLVLMQNPQFADGLGMDVHIRTTIQSWWSYIDTVAIQIDGNTLEITGGSGEIPYYLNGEKTDNMETGDAKLGEFDVRFRRVNDHQTITHIHVGHGDAISVETYKKFVRVNVKDDSGRTFEGTVGLLGLYPTGQKLSRDGKTLMKDDNEFGQEWQVRASEPALFHEVVGPQHPVMCTMPSETEKVEERRRLGESAITAEDAARACSHAAPKEQDECIFDVLATNELDIAGTY